MKHGKLLRILFGDGVNHVVSEIELLNVLEVEREKSALLVLFGVDELLDNEVVNLSCGNNAFLDLLFVNLFVAGNNNSKEQAVFSVNGDHAVRC